MRHDHDEQRQELYKISTNEVLIEENISQVIYFLPCYVRLKVKQLVRIDISEQNAIVSGTILVSIYYGNLDRKIVEQFTGSGAKSILMKFCRQEPILLKEDKQMTVKNDWELKRIDCMVTQDFICTMDQDLFMTPFQVINLHFAVTFPTLTLSKDDKGRDIEIKVNCMDSHKSILIDHGKKTSLGLYSLATHFLEAQYSNTDHSSFRQHSIFNQSSSQTSVTSSKTKQDSKQTSQKARIRQVNGTIMSEIRRKQTDDLLQSTISIDHIESEQVIPFQYAHFRIPIYKHPGTTLIQVFTPMWVLAFINLMVYFQDNVLTQKLAVTTTVAVAYIAFIPFIKSAIPTTSGIKLMDIIIFIEVAMTFFTIFDAIFTVKNEPATFVFDWKANGWYLTTLIIDIISVAVVLGLFVVHKVYWERTYIAPKEKGKQRELLRELWSNEECDWEFKRVSKKRKIATL